MRREYFRLRPLRFRVPDVSQQAEAPRVWAWEVAGAPSLRLQRSQSSELLEREVESVLRREQELAEERRNALFPEVFSPPPAEGCDPDSGSSSAASGEEGCWGVAALLRASELGAQEGGDARRGWWPGESLGDIVHILYQLVYLHEL